MNNISSLFDCDVSKVGKTADDGITRENLTVCSGGEIAGQNGTCPPGPLITVTINPLEQNEVTSP